MTQRSQFLLVLAACLVTTISVHAAEAPIAITADDPKVTSEILALRLDPLTKDELGAEAAAWQALLKSKAQEIAESSIASRTGTGDKQAVLRNLDVLREQKAALLERFDVVLDAYEVKGGDAEGYRKYASAVSGIRTDVTDVGSSWHLVRGWLKSKEGGIKWGIRILQFLGVMVVFWFLASVISKVISKALKRHQSLSGLLRNFINTMSRRVILLVGLLIALGTVGVNVGAALALIGGGAFVLAFALQDTLGNLANGLMLMIYRPFDVGDAVEVGGVTGKVDNVSLVNTTITTFDNKKVIVPNKSVWGEVITNITGMPNRRVDMTFGIGYDDDTGKARQILERIVSGNEKVLKEPAPVIRLHELADSSVNFICRPWTATADYWEVYWEITRQVKVEFDSAGISIPYPQQDVHLHNVTDSKPE